MITVCYLSLNTDRQTLQRLITYFPTLYLLGILRDIYSGIPKILFAKSFAEHPPCVDYAANVTYIIIDKEFGTRLNDVNENSG